MASVIWLSVACAALIIEVATVNLVSVWFVVGALSAFVASFFNIDVIWQVVIFIAVSGILLLLMFPLAKKLRNKKHTATNADRIIGQDGVVIQTINNIDAVGQIKVLGNIWSAKSEDDKIIEKDKKVKVLSVSGVKAVVKEAD